MDLRSLVLSQDDLATKTVTVPEWKDADGKPLTLTLRMLDATERELFEAERVSAAGLRNIRAMLVAWCVRDDAGKRVFSTDDVEALGKKNSPAMCRLFNVALKLNKMTKEDIEELEKN